jgi:DNA-binding GntR family transcriptional regulator
MQVAQQLVTEAPDTPLGGTIYQRVRDRIRGDILSGRIGPGARLKITDLAGRYGLSHMPVREALQQLQGEGLVTLSPNRGASVRHMDAAFIRSLFDIREALEGFLTRQAAERMTQPMLDRVTAIQRRYDAASEAGDLQACIPLNIEFHRVILSVSGNEEAQRLIAQHTDLIGALRARVGYARQRPSTIRREHHALIEALARRDGEAAQRIHALHVRRAGDDMLDRMRAVAAEGPGREPTT